MLLLPYNTHTHLVCVVCVWGGGGATRDLYCPCCRLAFGLDHGTRPMRLHCCSRLVCERCVGRNAPLAVDPKAPCDDCCKAPCDDCCTASNPRSSPEVAVMAVVALATANPEAALLLLVGCRGAGHPDPDRPGRAPLLECTTCSTLVCGDDLCTGPHAGHPLRRLEGAMVHQELQSALSAVECGRQRYSATKEAVRAEMNALDLALGRSPGPDPSARAKLKEVLVQLEERKLVVREAARELKVAAAVATTALASGRTVLQHLAVGCCRASVRALCTATAALPPSPLLLAGDLPAAEGVPSSPKDAACGDSEADGPTGSSVLKAQVRIGTGPAGVWHVLPSPPTTTTRPHVEGGLGTGLLSGHRLMAPSSSRSAWHRW